MIETTAHLHNFITSLLFTNIVEITLLFLMVKKFISNEQENIKFIFVGLLASSTTLPYVSFVFPKLFIWPRSVSLVVAELFATIIEAILYKSLLKLNWKQAFVISLICNLASYYLSHFLQSNGFWFYW